MITADLRRLARENGLFFPPDPGAAEQSQLGGNIATNAGGPHAFKYGVTGAWVTGLEVVLAPGELVRVGGPIRKDVAGYDLKSPDDRLGGDARDRHRGLAQDDPRSRGGAAPRRASTRTRPPAVPRSKRCSRAASFQRRSSISTRDRSRRLGRAFPVELPNDASFMVLVEADGTGAEAAHIHEELTEALSEDAVVVHAPTATKEINALWRWRDGASIAVTAQRGGRSPRTSSFRSTGSAKRSTRRSRSGDGTTCQRAAGGTPATATCTRRS